ncbi:MAG: hypothetical protein PHQ00_04800 [Phycisphaerae bacterium]|nr:hypothetical protein [Phycisphaerae bacterium]
MLIQIIALAANGSNNQIAAAEFAPFALVALPYVLLIVVSVIMIKIR